MGKLSFTGLLELFADSSFSSALLLLVSVSWTQAVVWPRDALSEILFCSSSFIILALENSGKARNRSGSTEIFKINYFARNVKSRRTRISSKSYDSRYQIFFSFASIAFHDQRFLRTSGDTRVVRFVKVQLLLSTTFRQTRGTLLQPELQYRYR